MGDRHSQIQTILADLLSAQERAGPWKLAVGLLAGLLFALWVDRKTRR